MPQSGAGAGGGRRGCWACDGAGWPGFRRVAAELRDDAGLPQDVLAEAAQVSQRAVSDLERASIAPPARTPRCCWPGRWASTVRRVIRSYRRARRTPAADVVTAVHSRPPGESAAAAEQSACAAGAVHRPEEELSEVRALVESCCLVTLAGASRRPGGEGPDVSAPLAMAGDGAGCLRRNSLVLSPCCPQMACTGRGWVLLPYVA